MIFYFTGTGNSLYAAKHFDKELYSIPKEMKKESRKYTAGILCRENQQYYRWSIKSIKANSCSSE
jgi:hypothetical protein